MPVLETHQTQTASTRPGAAHPILFVGNGAALR